MTLKENLEIEIIEQTLEKYVGEILKTQEA